MFVMSFSKTAPHRSRAFIRNSAYSQEPEKPAKSAHCAKNPCYRRCDVTDRDRGKYSSRHGVYYHALERGAGGTRTIACGAGGTRKALPHVLATDLWFCAARGR